MHDSVKNTPGGRLLCDRYYKTEETGRLYETLLAGLLRRDPRVPCPGASREAIGDALHRILLDHPLLFYFEGQWRYDGDVLPVYNSLTQYDLFDLETHLNAVCRHFSSVGIPDNRVEAVFRWLAANVRYDPSAPNSQNAYGALAERRAVCKGIAKAFQLILRRLEIPCILVEGSLDGIAKHVWNCYYLHGKWRHCDVTMSYPQFLSRSKSGDPMEYLSMETSQITQTHIIDEPERLPTSHVHYFHSLSNIDKKSGHDAELLPPRLRNACTGGLRHIASGSVSDVFETTFRGAPAVIKQIRCGLDMNRMYHAMRECAMTQLVQLCPGTVRLLEYDVVRTSGGFTVFLVQEKLTPLDSYCVRRGVTVRNAVRIALELCRTLEQCRNAGVAHLDIQPGNVFIDPVGRTVLGDFSSALPVEELTTLRQLRGTPAYMAPEVRRDCRYSQASEVCSLGLLLYSLLSGGALPFSSGASVMDAANRRLSGEPVQLRRDMIPDALCALVEKACAFDSNRRYSTLADLRRALETVLTQCADDPIRPVPSFSGFRSDTGLTQSTLCGTWPVPSFSGFRSDTELTQSTLCGTWPGYEEDYGVSRLNPETSCADPNPWGGTLPLPDTVFDSDSMGFTTALEAPNPVLQTDPEPVRVDQVQFSAVAPQSAAKGEYSLVQLFMYEQAFRSAVEEALQMGDGPMQEKKTGLFRVESGTQVKVVLSSNDVEIADDTLEQVWTGGYLCFDFSLEIPFAFPKHQILLKAAVYFNGIPATRLLLTMKTHSLREQKLEVSRSDVMTAFVSYASQDRSRVGALVQGMRKARPDMDIFFDVSSLRSGENWEAALLAEIEKRDTLFLCWSANARQSPWVDREWRYALVQKGPDAIEPIPIDPPDVCPPPEELKSKHFNDQLLYIINR